MPSLSPNEKCRVLVDGKYKPAVCVRAHAKTIRVRLDGAETLVPHEAVWKLKRATTSAKKKTTNVGARSVEKLPVRRGRFRRPVTVVPVRFRPGLAYGDYGRMMTTDKYMLDGVLGFNDNDHQWQRFLNTKYPDGAGGGNAVAREVQHRGDAIGIPTGPYWSLHELRRDVLFPEDDGEAKDRTAEEIIDRAFEQIRDLFLARPDKTVLYYSAEDDNDNIGLRIFAGQVGPDVIARITERLKAVPEAVRAARFA